jgi:hypothetical protein
MALGMILMLTVLMLALLSCLGRALALREAKRQGY